MLNVQVQYLNYLESKRHDLAQEDIGYQTIRETVRHDTVVENQNQQSINETIQHNRAQEQIGYMQAQAALSQAATARMLANAQIPLINEQTRTQAYQTKLTRNKAYSEYYNAVSEKAKSEYNSVVYGMSDSTKGQKYGEFTYGTKMANEIIPF